MESTKVNSSRFKFILFLGIVLSMLRCSLPTVKVVVDTQDASKHLIVFDEKDSLKLHQKNISVQLSTGRHSFKVDQDSIQYIIVGNRGGLLNLDKQNYIGFSIDYEAHQKKNESAYDMGMVSIPVFVLIDSYIVVNIPRCYKPSDEIFSLILPKLKTAKYGNYLEMDTFNSYDTTKEIYGLKQFGKDQIFINKFWDYDLDEEAPHSISITRSADAVGKARSSRSSIIQASIFIQSAKNMPAEYSVCAIKDLIKPNNH